MKLFKPVILFLIASATLLASCSNTASGKNTIELISYETDIEGLSIREVTSKDSQHLNIKVVLEPYVNCWMGRDYTVVSAVTGEEVRKKDEYRFPDDQLRLEKDAGGKSGTAEKEFWIDMFEFRETGEYQIHNELYLDPAESLGTLDLLVKVQISKGE